jgi:hypothetical protein
METLGYWPHLSTNADNISDDRAVDETRQALTGLRKRDRTRRQQFQLTRGRVVRVSDWDTPVPRARRVHDITAYYAELSPRGTRFDRRQPAPASEYRSQ